MDSIISWVLLTIGTFALGFKLLCKYIEADEERIRRNEEEK